VVSMLAGDVFDAPGVIWRLRIFRFIYAMTALRIAPDALRAWWQRRRAVRVDLPADAMRVDNG